MTYQPSYRQAGAIAAILVETTGSATVASVMAAMAAAGTPASRSTARTGLWRAWKLHWPDWTIRERPRLELTKGVEP